MLNAIVIFVGSGLGGLARWWMSGWVTERVGHTYPWGTLVVNVSGSFLIGLVGGLMGEQGRWPSATGRIFLMAGVCGGYTTFSSFSLQTLHLLEQGAWGRAGSNVLLSVVLCLVGVGLGQWVSVWFQPARSS